MIWSAGEPGHQEARACEHRAVRGWKGRGSGIEKLLKKSELFLEVKAVAFMSGGFSNEPTHTKTSRESNTLSTFVTVGFGSPSGVTL